MRPFTLKKYWKFKMVTAAVLLSVYVGAFLIVHTSPSLLKPAANMMYYYYSDNPVVEDIEFYGFWPLRQIFYHVPGFEMRHERERIYIYDPNPSL